jgi:hexosaminidase
MKSFILFFVLTMTMAVKAQNNINVIPMPAEVKMGKGIYDLNRNTVIVLEGSGMERTTSFFNNYLQQMYGYKLNIVKKYTGSNCIRLNFERLDHDIAGAYTLTIDKNGIYIAGDNEAGVFYGMQSLVQLIQDGKKTGINNTGTSFDIPYLTINDYPRFAYRGMHLDVGRHFFSVDFIKKYIDFLAVHKFNTFHWHLTEDQGWRIEIKKYPLLTQVGSCRNRTLIGRYGSNKYDSTRYCGFYTQDQVKDIVKYAADRYITIIPEIEMPGHSTAALASYPFLGCTKGPYKVMDTWGVLDDVYCAGNDSTFTFLQNVLDEVMQLFPSKYIHIGGDECPKERWKTCPLCQKRIKDQNLKDEHALQSYFIQRIEKYLNSKGRNIIGWDEILEGGLAPNATVMSWRGEEGGIEAAKQDHDVIMTPGTYCYLDHSQSKNEDSLTIGGYLPLETVYGYDPVPAALTDKQAKHILGAQGNVWTEYMETSSKVEYMIFPRMSALSEVLWTPKEKKNWNDFERRLPILFDRLDAQKINYSKAYYDLKATVIPSPDFDGVLWKLESKFIDAKINYALGGISNDLPYETPVKVQQSQTYSARLYKNEKIVSAVGQSFHFNLATGKKITLLNEPHKSYPGIGAFTLVDGVQNEKGLAKSSEFLGFLGKDLDAVIDLGKQLEIRLVKLYLLEQKGSWIYPPSNFEVYTSDDGINFKIIENADAPKAIGITKSLEWGFSPLKTRYIKVIAKNFGIIPSGNPGAGNPAWLFADEIEVQ